METVGPLSTNGPPGRQSGGVSEATTWKEITQQRRFARSVAALAVPQLDVPATVSTRLTCICTLLISANYHAYAAACHILRTMRIRHSYS